MRYLFIFWGILFSLQASASLDNLKQDLLVEIQVSPMQIKNTISDLKLHELDITYADPRRGLIHVLINHEDFEMLKSITPNLAVKKSRYVTMKPDANYKTYDDIQQIIKTVASRFPALVHQEIIGKTLEGRDVVAVRISDDQKFNNDEPAILFNALHHAREVMTVEIIQDILESLTDGYANDEVVKTWVNELQIWLVPMVNPDGSNKVWTGDYMWRKNVRNDQGVDINRNYPYKWGACNGSSSSPWAENYRGPSAASEPETQVMMKFIERVKPVYSISYHSYGGMVIHPYGCEGELPSPEDKVVESSKDIGKLLSHRVGAAWQILYDVDGGDIDWMYGVHHVLPFVIELGTDSDGFQPPYSRRDPVVTQNRLAWKYLLAKMTGVGAPSIPVDQPRTTTVRWGRWTDQFKTNTRSVMVANILPTVRVDKIVNGRWTFVFKHTISVTKPTQHYLLNKGQYRLSLLGRSGAALKVQNFNVTDAENPVLNF